MTDVDARNAKYGQGTSDFAFGDRGELKLYRVRADRVAQLEAARRDRAPIRRHGSLLKRTTRP